MYKKVSHSKIVYALLLCIFYTLMATAQTTQKCDSLIQTGVAALWKKEYVKSLEVLTSARAMAEKNHWHQQLFLATNNIGANYYSLLDYGEALHYYLESYDIAKKHLKPVNEMVVLNNMAILYVKDKKYSKAGEFFRKAYTIAKNNNNTVKTGLYLSNLGSLYNETNDTVKGKKYIAQALPYLKNQPDLLLQAKASLAENTLLSGNYTAALKSAQQLYNNSPNLDYNDIGITLLGVITKAYIKQGNYSQAGNTANIMLTKNLNPEHRVMAFELLTEIYTKSNRPGLALQYKDSVIAATARINESKSSRIFENSRIKFDIQNYKNQLAINEEKAKAERNFFIFILAVIFAGVAIVLSVLRNRSLRHKERQLIAEKNQQLTALELEKEKNSTLLLEKQINEKEASALLEQERLKNEIEARNRKLSAKALYLSGRNELIEDIITSLSSVPELSKNQALSSHIKSLKSHVKSDDEWDSFILHFEEVNPGFLSRLKEAHPQLTPNDVRFISYIYMNLSTKEIASMLNITPEACRKRKERIATKIGLPSGTVLHDYLSGL